MDVPTAEEQSQSQEDLSSSFFFLRSLRDSFFDDLVEDLDDLDPSDLPRLDDLDVFFPPPFFFDDFDDNWSDDGQLHSHVLDGSSVGTAVDGLIVGSGEAGEGGAFGGVGMFVLMDGLLVLGFEVGELAVLVGLDVGEDVGKAVFE